MKFILYILFFICCYSGSFNSLDRTLNDRSKTNSEPGLPEINLSSNAATIQYLVIDDNICFDTQSDDDISVIKTARGYHVHNQLTKKNFHQDHPFCFSKSTDPYLELDIPPPFFC